MRKTSVANAFSQDMYIKHFTDLRVYQMAFEQSRQLFELSRQWPSDERFALTSQLRRAARAVGAAIAEAWGKRLYEAHFIQKLTDADAENHEVEHWISVSHSDGYIDTARLNELLDQKRHVGKMLGSMIQNPKPFLIQR